jgi:hypothetical protein
MSGLLDRYLELLTRGWAPIFARRRVRLRALEHALALACTVGRRTISRAICTLGRQVRDWNADYRFYSRRSWDEDRLFEPVCADFLARFSDGPIPIALDDTGLGKSGQKIPFASWQYDHQSPAFHANLRFGLRFITAALLFPHHRHQDLSARAFPIRFKLAPPLRKPGRRASDQEVAAYREARKRSRLSVQALAVLGSLRAGFDRLGAASRVLLLAVDGSYCNQILFKSPLDRIHLLARARRDASLCFRAPAGSRRFYSPHRFTPEQVRQDPACPWQAARVWFGGQWRDLRYKEVTEAFWPNGACRRPLRLLVLAPTGYRLSSNTRLFYRQPAYLLSTDLLSSAAALIQTYVDRWQIEVSHRDMKDLFGVGQAQVRHRQSVPRQPAFAVAAYSLLLLASLQCFGPTRGPQYLPLPRWRKDPSRPSLLDILSLLRKDLLDHGSGSAIAPNIARNALFAASA